jgi:hypothetical protein
MATSPPWPDPRLRCQHVKTTATSAWAHASTPPPSTRYRRLPAAASPAWTAGRSGSGSACANPADGSRAPMTHPASTPRHTTKKQITPSSSCSSTRTRHGAMPTSAPSNEAATQRHRGRDRRAPLATACASAFGCRVEPYLDQDRPCRRRASPRPGAAAGSASGPARRASGPTRRHVISRLIRQS